MKCSGKTKDGHSCDRGVSGGSEYCFQHVNGFWKKITYFLANIFGTKRRFLLWFLLFSFILFIIEGYAAYRYNKILERLELKPNIEVEISPYLFQAAFGEYLPLIVTNTGDYTLKDVHIFINSCTMDKNHYESFQLPLIPPHSERTLPFGNKQVIKEFKGGNCYPFSGEKRSYASFIISPSKLKEEGNYSVISTGCGLCLFNAVIFAHYISDIENKNFNKSIDSSFPSPISLTIDVGSS